LALFERSEFANAPKDCEQNFGSLPFREVCTTAFGSIVSRRYL
jgi:hypothetical protein